MAIPAEELLDFVENASLSLHWVDRNGIIIWANQAELDTLGYTREEYIGQPIKNFHADDHVIADILTRLTANETLLNQAARLKCKDGSIKHVLINSNVYRKDGDFVHTRCFTRDVTEMVLEAEKKAELINRLEESERLLRISSDIIASSHDAIISKDLNGKVTSWNRSAQATFGYTAEEMIGKPLSILFPPDRFNEEQLIYERLKAGEHVLHFQTQRVTKEKRTLDVSLAISPIWDRDGNMVGLSKIVRDITAEKKEENRKNDFVGMVSHELKTPLTSILGYIQMLLAKAKKTEDNFTVAALTKTENQTKKMVTMVQDFLNIGRLEDGKIRIKKEIFPIGKLITEVITEITMLNSTHTIIYEQDLENSVLADRDKIGQVINNLIGNAIKYSPNANEVKVICKQQDNKLTIAVKDKGFGISENDQLHLFERYYRVENETTGRIAGFGIGLYLVAEILRLHDSRIQVESVKDEGSTFYFELPIVDKVN